MATTAAKRRPARSALLWLALLAVPLAIRVAYLAEMGRTPFYAHPLIDEDAHVQMAHGLRADPLLRDAHQAFVRPPLYPYLLAGFMSLSGEDPGPARLCNVLLGAASAVLVFLLALTLFRSRPVAWVAWGVFSVYPYLIYADAELLSTSLETFLALLLVLVHQRRRLRRGAWSLALLGALGAALVLTRPTYAIFLGLLLLLEGAARRTPWPRLALVVAVFAACLLPVALRNRAVGGDWVPVSTNGGVNFYLGNNPEFERTVAIRPGAEWYALLRLPQREHRWRPADRDAYFWRLGADFARREPLAFLRNLGTKLAYTLSTAEALRDNDLEYFRAHSALLAALLTFRGWFALVLGLAACGAALLARRRTLARWGAVAAFLLTIAAVNVAFFPTSRYRLPAVPFLLLPAAFAAVRLVAWARRRARPVRVRARPLAAAGALAGAVALSLACRPPAAYVNAISAESLLGCVALYDDRDFAAAARHFEAALREDDRQADHYWWLARALDQLGEKPREEAVLRAGIARRPDAYFLHDDLGSMLADAGRLDEAEAEFLAAWRLAPHDEVAQVNLGRLAAARGRWDEAKRWMREAIALTPDDDDMYLAFGELCVRAGDAEELRAMTARWRAASPRSEKLAQLERFLEAQR